MQGPSRLPRRAVFSGRMVAMQRRALVFRWLSAGVMVLALLLGAAGGARAGEEARPFFDNTPQTLTFSQDWSNTGLITVDDDWSGVPGIIGYRGDGLAATGDDPQTVIADGSGTPVDVNANQTNPDTFTTGGISEFAITDPVIALQGSGTADAPHIVIHLNTIGKGSISVSYNLRDIDGSADDSVQAVALQYRVGSSGDFTNVPAGFVADATTAGAATLVTPVSVVLPAAVDNQPEVQIRIITVDAGGSDEWVGIDDIVITAGESAPSVSTTNPSAGATNVPVNADISITFSEPVNVADPWFNISCGSSGLHNAMPAGGPTTYTLDPYTDFVTDETCVVVILSSGVTDQDANDPPDQMTADYSFSFSTTVTMTPTRTLTPSRTPSPTRTPTPSPTATPLRTVLINEVGWMGTSSSNTGDEWVELYGPPNMDLTGWRLVGGDLSPNITLSGSTDANGFFVIASNNSVFLSFTYGQVDSSLVIENTEESLQLFDDNGVLIDTASPILISGVNRWPAGCGPSGYTCPTTNACTRNSSNTNYASMERRNAPDIGANWFTYAIVTPPVPVLDRNNKVVCGSPGQANWALSVTATPSKTPSRTPTATRTRTPTPFPTPVPIVVINEVMPRAGHDWNGDGNVDVYDEFIEIKNVGSLPANLSNYKLDDEKEGGSAPFTLRSLTLDPGERAVFYGSETGILLSDGGDTVLLLNARGTIVDAYTYSIADEPDRSFCRLFSNPGYWREKCFPTPGLENGYSGRYPPGPDGSREPVCLMPDTAPDDFIQAECEAAGLGIWNPEYWNTFPGEGEEQWIPIESEKDPAIYN